MRGYVCFVYEAPHLFSEIIPNLRSSCTFDLDESRGSECNCRETTVTSVSDGDIRIGTHFVSKPTSRKPFLVSLFLFWCTFGTSESKFLVIYLIFSFFHWQSVRDYDNEPVANYFLKTPQYATTY